jgi:hypothetical protein
MRGNIPSLMISMNGEEESHVTIKIRLIEPEHVSKACCPVKVRVWLNVFSFLVRTAIDIAAMRVTAL